MSALMGQQTVMPMLCVKTHQAPSLVPARKATPEMDLNVKVCKLNSKLIYDQ